MKGDSREREGYGRGKGRKGRKGIGYLGRGTGRDWEGWKLDK